MKALNQINGNRANGNAAHKLLALAVSTMAVVALLGVGEFYCRRFMKVNFLGNSRNLFVANRFGNSRGNLAAGEAVSFGVKVFTDENGFRIDPQFKDARSSRAILFLGDSVGFACGVEERQSAVGLLRRSLTNVRLYNSSSIGYCLMNYKDVVDYWLPQHKDVQAVYVLMCLNDIYDESAIEIRKSLGQAPEDRVSKDMVVLAKRFTVLQSLNDWARTRFKLLSVAKSVMSDSSMRVFSYDLEMYKHSEAYFDANMDALRQINERLRKVGIAFKVIVMPYEVQLRSKDAAVLLPQAMITRYLREHDIPFVDTTEIFRNTGMRSKELYLFEDAMHFSPVGHRVLADILMKDIRVTTAARP
jgi:lysophospholipase L1-like esterase